MISNISNKIFPENIQNKSTRLISYTKKILNIPKSKKIGIFQLPVARTIGRSCSLSSLEKYMNVSIQTPINKQITIDDDQSINTLPNLIGYFTPIEDSSSVANINIRSMPKHFSDNCLVKMTSYVASLRNSPDLRSYDYSSNNNNNVSSCFSSLCSLCSLSSVDSLPNFTGCKALSTNEAGTPLLYLPSEVCPLPNTSSDLRSPSELVVQRLQGTEAPWPTDIKMKGILGISLEYLSGYTEMDSGQQTNQTRLLESYNVQSPRNYFKLPK